MKKILLTFLILPLILLCGFTFKKEQKPYAVISSNPITKASIQRVEHSFMEKRRIYYSVVAPENFKYSGIRMQLSKQDDKTSNWGFSIIQTEDIYVVKGDKEFRGYVLPPSKGHYILQFFYSNNKRYPFIHREFMVQ